MPLVTQSKKGNTSNDVVPAGLPGLTLFINQSIKWFDLFHRVGFPCKTIHLYKLNTVVWTVWTILRCKIYIYSSTFFIYHLFHNDINDRVKIRESEKAYYNVCNLLNYIHTVQSSSYCDCT